MKTAPSVPPPQPPPSPALWHEAATARDWTIVVRGATDRLLLPRVLQKLAVPEVEVRALRYRVEDAAGAAGIELTCRTGEPRARLVARRLATLPAVTAVEVRGG